MFETRAVAQGSIARRLIPTMVLFLGAALYWASPGIAQDFDRGMLLYERLECSRCHGAKAEGDFGPRLAGTGLSFDAVLGQVRRPTGPMPAFPEGRLSDDDLREIYAWVTGLADQKPHYATWFGAELINLPTPEMPGERSLEVHFSHRFQESISDAGRQGLWGLDSFATPTFSFSYGIIERVSAYGGRSSFLATWEYGAKVELLREDDTAVPVSAAAVVGGTYLDTSGIQNKSRFTLEVPVGVRAHERLSLVAVPFLATNTDVDANPENAGYSAAFGLGGSFRMTPGMSIDVEWITNIGGYKRLDAVDQWQVFWGIKKGGHLFQIGVGNSILQTPDAMASGTLKTGRKSDVRIGFNLVRAFQF